MSKEIRIYTKDEVLKELFKDVKRYRLSLIIGDGRRKSVFNRAIDNTLKKIKEYGLSLEINNGKDIRNLKIRGNKITFKLVV